MWRSLFLDNKENILDQLSKESARLRALGEWRAALTVSFQLLEHAPDRAEVQHNLSVCLLAVGQAAQALHHAQLAIHIQPDLWQAHLVSGRALRAMGQGHKAGKLLADLITRFPDQPEIRLAFSEVALHEYSEARMARHILSPLKHLPAYQRDIALTSIITQLYDRDIDGLSLSNQIRDFSALYLSLPEQADPHLNLVLGQSNRLRVGFISPQFFISPVYFFCIGAIKNLAQIHDLIFFHRGSKNDWATEEFKQLAILWFDAKPLNSEALAELIKKQNLDVLLDLGGWMDPLALRALSTRPAKKQYKWVGGQSATTGLHAFDGFISDKYQSPVDTQKLYSEPLVLLDSGYVSYQPPSYLPQTVQPNSACRTVGVISNPVKVSLSFLTELRLQALPLQHKSDQPVVLDFIDKRYQHGVVRQRILNVLKPQNKEWPNNVKIRFIAPKDHKEYLQHVASLDWVIDTWPYTGGLTTMEALAMGVPCRTRIGQLFCERHTYAHCRYAGLEQAQVDIEQLGMFEPYKKIIERNTILSVSSPRLNHQAVANALSAMIASKSI